MPVGISATVQRVYKLQWSNCMWSSLKLLLSSTKYRFFAGSLSARSVRHLNRAPTAVLQVLGDGKQGLGTGALVAGSSVEASRDGRALVDLEYNKKNKVLRVEFEDGARFGLPAEFLRVQSPAARSSNTVVHGRRYVGILDIEPVGRYAVKIRFDDLHSSGLYTYELLRQLGEKKFAIMKRYVRQLKTAGLSRDPLRNATRNEQRGTRNLSS